MSPPKCAEQLYTVPEVAKLLGVKTRDSVYDLIHSGELDVVRVGARKVIRVPESTLVAYQSRHRYSARRGAA